MPRMLARRSLIAAFATFALFGAAACAPNNPANNGADSDTDATTDSAVVNLYSSRHYDTDEALYEDFTEQTGIEVKLIEGDADELIERMKTEGDNSPADVFITVDAGRLWRAEQEGLLQSVSSTALEEAIPENLRHPDGLWFGLSRRARIIVYSKDRVDPTKLSSYEALGDPQWEGRICVRSSGNIYNQSLVASLIESKGLEATENWIKSLVANFARPPEGPDTGQIKAVAEGACDVAIVNHYYFARIAKSDDPEDRDVVEKVALFFPEPTHVNISGAGVVKTAPNSDNAVKFIEYLATPEAQAIYAAANNEYPAIAGVETDDTVTDFGDFEADDVNVSAYGRNNPDAIEAMDRAGWK